MASFDGTRVSTTVVASSPTPRALTRSKSTIRRCGICSLIIVMLAVSGPLIWKHRDRRQFNFRTTADEAVLVPVDLSRKTVIVTGASSGIGIETVRVLLERGASVVMGCRNITKAAKVRKDIIRTVTVKRGHETEKLSRLRVIELDLSSIASIHSFAMQFKGNFSSLDYLVLNAGIRTATWTATADGLESHFGVNHIGHAILTHLLIPKMVSRPRHKRAIARVVVVSSWEHRFSPTPLVDWLRNDTLIQNAQIFNSLSAYGLSKAANILFAAEFNERYAASGIYAVSLHPGTVSTELVRESHWSVQWIWSTVFGDTIFKSPSQGAATTLRVLSLSDEEFVENGGRYFRDCNVADQDLRSDLFPTDVDRREMPQKVLWDVTESIKEQVTRSLFQDFDTIPLLHPRSKP